MLSATTHIRHSERQRSTYSLFSYRKTDDDGMVILPAILVWSIIFFNLWWCMSWVCAVRWITLYIKIEADIWNGKRGRNLYEKRAINTKLHIITNAFLLKCKCSSALWYTRDRCAWSLCSVHTLIAIGNRFLFSVEMLLSP